MEKEECHLVTIVAVPLLVGGGVGGVGGVGSVGSVGGVSGVVG